VRDKETVVLDILAGLQLFHDGTELGDTYADLYQAVGILLLSDRVSPAERVKFLNAMSNLPEPDQQIVRLLLQEVMCTDKQYLDTNTR
jgi:hypothetical protein